MISSLIEIYIINQLTNFSTTPIIDWNPASLLTADKIPVHDGIHIAPVIEANSALIVDLDSGLTLFDKNQFTHLPIASITKLMTAIIILEENKLDGIVTVSSNAAQTEGSKIWLYPGEEIRVSELLYALLIHSGNDAAIALAEHNAGTVEAFVEKMNQKADQLGLYNTKFSNPIGFDDENNYSTSHDLAILGRYAFKKTFIQRATSIQEMTITSTNGKLKHDLKTTNDLLFSEAFNIKGLKTGHTDLAGQCLISIAENQNHQKILTVVLNSPDRFKETKILIDWAFRAYKW